MRSQSKQLDRRAIRTRQSLSEALIALIREQRWDAITVQHVIDRAGVSRSTFYAHYRGKDDLLRNTLAAFLSGIGLHIRWQSLPEGRVVPVLELFTHLEEEFHQLYNALARSRKTDLFFRIGPAQMAVGIEQSLATWLVDKPTPSVPLPVLANHLAASILSLLKWWLDEKMPYEPKRMDQFFHELVMPGLRTVLHSSELGISAVTSR